MVRVIAKMLPCRLSDKEISSRTQDLLILMNELETEAEAEKSRRKEWKNEQDERKTKIDELRGQIASRIENRQTRCEERRNDQLKTMDIIRIDDRACWTEGTDIVNSRPLSPSELQIELIADHRRDREGLEGEGEVVADGESAEVDPFEGTDPDDDDGEDEEEGEEGEPQATIPPPTTRAKADTIPDESKKPATKKRNSKAS